MAFYAPLKNKYAKREIKYFAEEHKKKPITFVESVKEGEKIAFGIPKLEHTKGKVVKFEGKFMVIREVRKDGVVLEPVEVRDGNLIDNPLPKQFFVKESEYHKIVHAHPLYSLT
jgi:hypothetical protein